MGWSRTRASSALRECSLQATGLGAWRARTLQDKTAGRGSGGTAPPTATALYASGCALPSGSMTLMTRSALRAGPRARRDSTNPSRAHRRQTALATSAGRGTCAKTACQSHATQSKAFTVQRATCRKAPADRATGTWAGSHAPLGTTAREVLQTRWSANRRRDSTAPHNSNPMPRRWRKGWLGRRALLDAIATGGRRSRRCCRRGATLCRRAAT
mmetsp:Transcript_29050/g.68900  ORF Transcript_29050/g.68900 Transcript_29050/m.68900 type:complete len:214 (-) Transcript_29050:1409-2050(-)